MQPSPSLGRRLRTEKVVSLSLGENRSDSGSREGSWAFKNWTIDETVDHVSTQIVPQVGRKPGIALVVLCGSFVEGFQDSHSDLDILAITDNLIGEEKFNLKGLEVVVKYVPNADVEGALQRADPWYSRWIIGARILDGDATLLSRLQSYVKPQAIAISILPMMVNEFKDMMGSYYSNDLVGAITCCRTLATFAGQVLLLSHNAMNIKPRWLIRQLGNCGESELTTAIRRILLAGPRSRADIKWMLARTIRLANVVVSGDKLVDRRKRTDRFARRHRFVFWLGNNDGTVELIDPRGEISVHVLNEAAGDIWRLLDGANNPDMLATILSKKHAISKGKIRAHVGNLMTRLTRLGLLETRRATFHPMNRNRL